MAGWNGEVRAAGAAGLAAVAGLASVPRVT
jgi:hypothetical protein